MTTRRTPPATVMRLWVGVALLTQAGCMSALTSVSLREAVLETVDSLAEVSAGRPPRETRDAEVSASVATDAPAAEQPEPMTLDEAVDRAVARLKSAGRLDAATQATLLTILESTQPEDWPAAIDAFTASLEARPPSPRAMAVIAEPSAVIGDDGATAPATADPAPVARDDAPTTSDPPPVPSPAEPEKLDVVAARPVVPEPPLRDESPVPPPAPPVASELVADGTIASVDDKLRPGDESGSGALAVIDDPVADATEGVSPPAAPEPTVLPRPLIVRNPCFVSRVRAWGVVDRFQQQVFRPGQEVIVYFELDAPLARESAGGHATSIDTVFRLVATDGREIGRWAFEPIDESCDSPRRDYFARYFLRMPEDAPPGPCRLEFVVTDLVAGLSTPAQLDLELR